METMSVIYLQKESTIQSNLKINTISSIYDIYNSISTRSKSTL